MTWNNVQPPCNTRVHCAQCSQHHWNNQCPTLPHVAYLLPQVTVLCQLLSLFSGDVAISRTADINMKTTICPLISETDVRTIGTDLPSSRDDCIPHHSAVIRLHKPIRMMPVPSALHWDPKLTTNVPVDNAGHLILLISVVHWCQGAAKAASGTAILMQNVALIMLSPKSLVLSSNNQSLSCSRKIAALELLRDFMLGSIL